MKTAFTTHVTNNLFLALKAVALLLAPIIVYSQDLTAIANEAMHSELASYTLAIPILITYVIYRKRKILRINATFKKEGRIQYIDEIIGLTLCLLAIVLYLYGSYTFYTLELHLISLPIFVAGCTLILFNLETLKTLAFPTALLFMLSIPPLDIAYLAGAMLSNSASQISHSILKFIGLPVNLTTPEGSPILVLYSASGLPLEFAIEVACSGIYSLLGFAIFAFFAAYLIRGTLWKKITIFLVGFPLIFALNIARILLIVLIGYGFGQGTAMAVFHLAGGWTLIFVGTFILLFLSEKTMKIKIFTSKTQLSSCLHCGKGLKDKQDFCLGCGKLLRFPKVKISKREILKMSAIILSAFLIVGVEVPVFATSRGPAGVIVQTSHGLETVQALPEISGTRLLFMYRDTDFEKLYGQDASLIYAYLPENGPIIWATLEISKARGPLHNWEVCYSTYVQRGQLAVLDLRDVQLSQNPPIIGRFYSFQVVESNLTETILYWYTRTVVDNEWKYIKISIFADAFNEDYTHVEEELLPFATAIIAHWEPIQSWSLMAIAIARHGILLMIMAIALPLSVLMYAALKKWKDKRLNQRIYKRLASDDKRIFKAVQNATKKGKPTTNAIALSYQEIYGKPIEDSRLLEKLRDAEELGLIRESIANVDDNPLLIWKSQIPNLGE